MTAALTLYEDGARLAGEIAQDLYDEFWAKADFRYQGTNWELLGSDEEDAHGLGTDDPYLTVLRRKSDGQMFKIEIEVSARPIAKPAPPVPACIPGQEALPSEVAR